MIPAAALMNSTIHKTVIAVGLFLLYNSETSSSKIFSSSKRFIEVSKGEFNRNILIMQLGIKLISLHYTVSSPG